MRSDIRTCVRTYLRYLIQRWSLYLIRRTPKQRMHGAVAGRTDLIEVRKQQWMRASLAPSAGQSIRSCGFSWHWGARGREESLGEALWLTQLRVRKG